MVLKRINHKFYAIALLLLLLFTIGYAQVALFLDKQAKSAERSVAAGFIEAEIQSLQGEFWETRFWERAMLAQSHPDADKRFMELMSETRKSIAGLRLEPFSDLLAGQVARISSLLAEYERCFSRLIQLKTEQRLNLTNFDTNQQAFFSAILMNGQIPLLKPLFNLARFQESYLQHHRDTEYQALEMILESIEAKLSESSIVNTRLKDFIATYRSLLDRDFTSENELHAINRQFDAISVELTALFATISKKTGALTMAEKRSASDLMHQLRITLLFSAGFGIAILFGILLITARKMVKPIKTMSTVVARVQAGNLDARFVSPDRDELTDLGFAFNTMLDTINEKNLHLLSYKASLENKVKELAHSEDALRKHQNQLKELVDERTSELVRVNRELTGEIEERKRAEGERMVLQERLQRAEKMEALGTLAGGVAHDLNNVLGIVVGYSEMLLHELPEVSPAHSEATAIFKGGQRAAAIVQDLLTLARRGIQARKTLNLNHILMECQSSPEFAKVLSYHPNVTIDSDLLPDVLNISGSSVHLEKSFMNLVSNAAEAMPQGGTLTIRTRNQYLDRPVCGYDEVKEGDYVVLSVSDTGEGIAAADLKRIFEPFYTKKVMGRSGTGLGLAVVWGTVRDHQGYINVQSEEGKGTTFTLYFPITRDAIALEQASLSSSEYMGNGESILVIDDIEEQRELAARMLAKLNYRVSTVSSGEDAVQYLTERSVDLLVVDMIMDPGMDGLDTYAGILKIHPKQKAIIVSGFSETERVSQAQALGAGAYVRKPYVLEKLGLAVRKELDRLA